MHAEQISGRLLQNYVPVHKASNKTLQNAVY